MFSLLLSNFKLVGSFCWWGQRNTVKSKNASVYLGMQQCFCSCFTCTEYTFREALRECIIQRMGIIEQLIIQVCCSLTYTIVWHQSWNCTQGSIVHQSLCSSNQFWIIVYFYFSDLLWKTNFFKLSVEYFPLRKHSSSKIFSPIVLADVEQYKISEYNQCMN